MKLPAWMPKETADAVWAYVKDHPEPYTFCFCKGERKVFHKRQPVAVSSWAEKHRVLTMSSVPGRWKNVFTPYLRGIMNTMGTKGVETVIICKSPQTGGSEAGHNFVGYCIDRDPGPVMYVFPDEITARENAHDRIIPMLKSSPRLREYLTGLDDDTSNIRITLAHMPIYLAWSGSVSRLGNKPVRTLILDELDKYRNPKGEADSEQLAEKRTITWRTRRHILKISTPTTPDGPIWRAFMQEAEARFDFWVKCPSCGHWQLMKADNLAWPGKGTDDEPAPERIQTKRLAVYPCEQCGAAWDDNARDLAVRAGEWREHVTKKRLGAYISAEHPRKVAFHIPAWISYFVSLSEVAAAYIRSEKSGRLSDVKDFMTQYAAVPWEQKFSAREEESVLALCDDRPRGAVPGCIEGKPRAAMLLAGVDTQKNHFRYVIRAFGCGETEESWLIQAGIVDTTEALDKVLWESSFKDADGREYKVRGAMIDAMGSRTAEIYRYAIGRRGLVYPWQGVRTMSQPYTPAPIEYYPDKTGHKVRIPGGINLWRCDVTFFKNDLAHKLEIHPDDPGAFHLHSNAKGELQEYASEMCAEVYDDKVQAWVNPRARPNHYWDCEVMARALAYILQVRYMSLDVRTRVKTAESAPRSLRDRFAAMRRY